MARVSQEMLAIADVQAAGVGEAQIGLVHQRGGIEQGIAAALAQPRARQPAQFLVGCIEYDAQCRFVAVLRATNEVSQ